MTSTSFDKNGLDKAGIHWMQYLSMTSMSLLIFLIALDKAVPSFHQFHDQRHHHSLRLCYRQSPKQPQH